MNNALYHHGIKGMHWGVRRYQNDDGSLTPEGIRRYNRDVAENNSKKKDNRIVIDKDNPDVNRWVKEDISRRKKTVDNIAELNKKGQEALNKSRKKQKLDLSNMTDSELRERINRVKLEREYNDMFAQETTSKGKQYVSKILEYGGTALAVTGSALGIALSIQELTGGRKPRT